MLKIKTCEVMQYIKYMPNFDVDKFLEKVDNLTNLKTRAFIIHDKDKDENGNLKEPHFHMVLTFSDTTTTTTVARALGIEEQYINKIKYSTKSAELYLIHRNDIEKYQYPITDVKANFDYVLKYDGTVPLPKFEEIADKIDKGIIKPYNIHEFVDISFYAKNKTRIDRSFEYRQNKLKGIDRDMKCVFITGASGVGKTSFAKMYATNCGYNCYISSGGKHPLDDYKGQECIILDDLRDSDYKLSDFLKLTDNNTDSLVGCRFYNKSIAECKLLIVTSIKSIYDFYNNITKYENAEPQVQLFRRFQTYIVMKEETMDFYSFDLNLRDYKFSVSCINPVSVLYNTKVQKESIEGFIKVAKLKVCEPSKDEFSPVKNASDCPWN